MKIKILLFLGIIGLLQSCGGDDETIENVNPSTSIVSITDITDFDAEVNVSMENASLSIITDRGIVYGLANNPTIADNNIAVEGNQDTFSVTINGLTSATQYFVRSYFIVGGDVTYSSNSDFLTTNSCENNVFQGNVTLLNQDMVNDFGSNNYCTITGQLEIQSFDNNPPITDLSPLNSLSEVGELRIFRSNSLISLSGLESINTASSIDISDNMNLLNIDALSNINTPDNSVIVINNASLQNLDGFSGLTSLNAGILSLNIIQNPLLTSISGFLNLQTVTGKVLIADNPLLNDISGFKNITNFAGDFNLSGCNNLTTLEGLNNLVSVDELFILRDLPNLIDISALSNLEEVGGISITRATTLNSLSALNSLTNANELLSINELVNLESLDGLNNVETANILRIRSNEMLVNFCAITSLIANGGFNGSYDVSDNAYNPTQQDIVDGNCSE